jgi:hypothetical protein
MPRRTALYRAPRGLSLYFTKYDGSDKKEGFIGLKNK